MISNGDIIGRLLTAALLGSVIGLERERLLWAAGIRTHMLVCVGSCLVMIVSAFGFADALAQDHVTLDPSRIAAQVVSGIGFLGAGTILLRGEVVKGLTTAASLWVVAAIGLAAGAGLYVASAATTAIVLAILAGVKPIEERYRERMQRQNLHLVAERGSLSLEDFRTLAGPYAARIRQFIVQPAAEDGRDDITICLVQIPRDAADDIVRRLRARSGVVSVAASDATPHGSSEGA